MKTTTYFKSISMALVLSLVIESLSFATEQNFVPVAFSVWDGFNSERGNRRGLTAWYYLYLKPRQEPSPLGPMLAYGIGLGLLELGLLYWVRRRYRG